MLNFVKKTVFLNHRFGELKTRVIKPVDAIEINQGLLLQLRRCLPNVKQLSKNPY